MKPQQKNYPSLCTWSHLKICGHRNDYLRIKKATRGREMGFYAHLFHFTAEKFSIIYDQYTQIFKTKVYVVLFTLFTLIV